MCESFGRRCNEAEGVRPALELGVNPLRNRSENEKIPNEELNE